MSKRKHNAVKRHGQNYIVSERETSKNRYGEKVSYCRYRLEAQ